MISDGDRYGKDVHHCVYLRCTALELGGSLAIGATLN